MPRTETGASEKVQRSIHIPIMRHLALTARPASYSKVCDTFRPRRRHRATRRADLGGESFADFLIARAMLNSLVREHLAEARPAGIENGLGHAGRGKSRGRDVTDRDVIELSHDAARELVQKVAPRVADARVDIAGLAQLVRSLRRGQGRFKRGPVARIVDLLSRGERHQILQSKVDPDGTVTDTCRSFRHINHDIQVPVSAAITREVGAVADLAFRQSSGLEHPERVSRKAKGIPLALQIAPLERHPWQRFPPAVSQVSAPMLAAGFGVLFADGIHRARMQPQLTTAAGGEDIQVKAARPLLSPIEGMLLSIVTEVPHEVRCPALSIQQTGERFHAIPVDQSHTVYITSIPFRWTTDGGSASSPS